MSSISAGTSVGTALVSTGDTTGDLVLKTGSSATTAVTIAGSNQAVTLAQPLGAASGGTGLTSPGTNGNVLTSNGTAWVSQALPAGGVTSLNGQTGAITNTDLYAIGSYVAGRPQNITSYAVNTTVAGSILYSASTLAVRTSGGTWENPISFADGVAGQTLVNTGTWRCVSAAAAGSTYGLSGLWVRIS